MEEESAPESSFPPACASTSAYSPRIARRSTLPTFVNFSAILKVVYCSLRENGKIRPLFVRAHYVPLMLREMGAASDVR